MASPLDSFFKLGEKATGGDPTRKAQFDYFLYWIVFLAFASIAFTYFHKYFTTDAPISTLIWGIVITIFCWFNYWGLVAFRGVYQNMKKAKEVMANMKKQPVKQDDKNMLKEFGR